LVLGADNPGHREEQEDRWRTHTGPFSERVEVAAAGRESSAIIGRTGKSRLVRPSSLVATCLAFKGKRFTIDRGDGEAAQVWNAKGDCPFRSGKIPGFLAKREGQSPFALPFRPSSRSSSWRRDITLCSRRPSLSACRRMN